MGRHRPADIEQYLGKRYNHLDSQAVKNLAMWAGIKSDDKLKEYMKNSIEEIYRLYNLIFYSMHKAPSFKNRRSVIQEIENDFNTAIGKLRRYPQYIYLPLFSDWEQKWQDDLNTLKKITDTIANAKKRFTPDKTLLNEKLKEVENQIKNDDGSDKKRLERLHDFKSTIEFMLKKGELPDNKVDKNKAIRGAIVDLVFLFIAIQLFKSFKTESIFCSLQLRLKFKNNQFFEVAGVTEISPSTSNNPDTNNINEITKKNLLEFMRAALKYGINAETKPYGVKSINDMHQIEPRFVKRHLQNKFSLQRSYTTTLVSSLNKPFHAPYLFLDNKFMDSLLHYIKKQ